jgi:hypothetical protein
LAKHEPPISWALRERRRRGGKGREREREREKKIERASSKKSCEFQESAAMPNEADIDVRGPSGLRHYFGCSAVFGLPKLMTSTISRNTF